MAHNTIGRFIWHDLMTTNVEQSLRFYSELFPEWTIKTIPLGEHNYYEIFVGDLAFGGLVGMAGTEHGPRTHWIGYIEVADCNETTTRCKEQGGKVVVPAFHVPGVGKFAVIQDPQGGLIKPFQADPSIAQADAPRTGHLSWNELQTNDVDGSRQFYQSVFGWSAVEKRIPGVGAHTAFRVGEREVAGCVSFPDEVDASPAWLTFIFAADIDNRVALAESLGAQTHMPLRSLYGRGRFTVLADPNGAAFALYNVK